MYTRFSATVVFDEDKIVIQALRDKYNLTEKLMMRALLQTALANEDALEQATKDVLQYKIKKGRKKKEGTAEVVEVAEELLEGAGV